MKRFLFAIALLFSALGISPMVSAACVYQSISIGETKSGSLTSDDCLDFNANSFSYYYDIYTFSGTSGQQISILNTSSVIDPDLYLVYPGGNTTVYNDDGGGGTSARIPATSGYMTLPSTGTYTLMASSAVPLQTGAYTLTLSASGTLPSAPSGITATAGNAQISVSFTPGAIGSGTLVSYTASCSDNVVSTTASGTSSPIVVTGLTNGTPYNCWVRTTSTVGASPWSASSNPATPTATAGTSVIEFYNTTLNHYFMTGDSQEAAGIDNGAAGPGWVRTGYEFSAWQTQGQASATANAVCRFYGTPGKGPNSHFYTADAGECAFVKNDPGWFYEGIALYAQPPQYGSCPLGTTPIYRVYNNRWMYNDSNHRFIIDSAVYQQMKQQGWVQEGLVMCVNGSSYPVPAGGTTATIGTGGGTVTQGSASVIFPANAVTSPTTVTISPGSATDDFPDATIVSEIKAIDIEGDIYKPIQVKMTATGAITGKVFAVVASDTYTASSAVPYFRGTLYEAAAAGNILTATIPPSAFGSQGASASQDRYSIMAASSSSSSARRRFTIWFITGYDLLQSSHFSISYPVKPCNSLVIRDYLQIAEDAYTKLMTNIGFSPAGLSWPMTISVIKLDPGKYGEAGYGRIGRWISGTKSLSLSINQQYCNSSAQADMDEMKATIGHEFFHTVQYVYDPHWAVRESVFGSPFTWLMEASSTWFEAEMLNNPSYASPVFTSNADFYRNGLERGGDLDAQEHGYGASGFLRYLSSKFGNSLILNTWKNVNGQSGTYSSTGALASANVQLSSEWQTFAEQYLTGTTSFGWAAPGSSGSAFRFVYSDTKPTAEFTDDLYPLSGVKILLDFNSLKQNKPYTVTLAEGQNSFIKAYLYKAKTKVAEFTDKYAFEATPASGFYLMVANSNATAPYKTPTHIKVKLESGPTITAISPAKGPTGTLVTISGSGFGTSADTRSVYFNGLKASTVTWNSDTSAVATVPQNASSGDVVVEVNTAKSNGMNFEVLAQCSSTQNAGGDTPDTRTIELGKAAGTFNFSYETYSVKDQIVVRYLGATLFDTGCVGAYGTKALTYSGSSTQITVQVIPNCAGETGTAWNYTVSCP